MLIIKFRAPIFKRKNMARVLELLSKRKAVSINDLIGIGLSKKGAWLILRDLSAAEYLERSNGAYKVSERVLDDAILLNPRDESAAALLKRRCMGAVLFWLMMGKGPSWIARELSIPLVTVKKALRDLREAGIVVGTKIKDEVLYEPADPVELIPRKVHREIARELIRDLEGAHRIAALVLFGDASFGRLTPSLDVLCLTNAVSAEEAAEVARMCASAARDALSTHAVQVNFYIAPVESWVALKHGFAIGSDAMNRALSGIIFYGREPTLSDYTTRMFELTSSKGRMLELTMKGLIKKGAGGVMLTEKAIKIFRKEPARLTESKINIGEKDIVLISIKMPS
ncbi:hypothetical protein [Thermofilum sp.]|uniref:hypothetical protein n=1 Tax=Thermofilum sp. TaxID=1961369 RepID=UPI003167E731